MNTEEEIYKIKMAILVLADYLEIENHTSFEIVRGIEDILNKKLPNKKISLWKKLLMILKTVVYVAKN